MAETTEVEPSTHSNNLQTDSELTNLGRAIAQWVDGPRGWKRLAADVAGRAFRS